MSTRSLARVITGHGIIPRTRWLERLLTMFDVRRTRIDLARLTDAQLNDIGLTRADVEQELARAAWDVPTGWRRR
ncbi:DUF1127 domain-containing protein [Paracoccus sediminilitoris]|uniref:DUF1127 domain-containing protein n=1 Tax=Paracoccus sediminilitoris TaxID=2202419 RepID=UPI00272D0148|nr:DUF1127 domain-containing protein [Paracoccus sediminilitoris]